MPTPKPPAPGDIIVRAVKADAEIQCKVTQRIDASAQPWYVKYRDGRRFDRQGRSASGAYASGSRPVGREPVDFADAKAEAAGDLSR